MISTILAVLIAAPAVLIILPLFYIILYIFNDK